MTARRIARELAVIILPQVPKDEAKLASLTIEDLVGRAVHMLVDHARQLLADGSAALSKTANELTELELNDDSNKSLVHTLNPVALNTKQLREELERIDHAVAFVSEALEIPEMTMHGGRTRVEIPCSKCKHVSTVTLERNDKSEVRQFVVDLISAYSAHRKEIDEIIRQVKTKWKVERMVSIDRDILRLAVTEMFFMPDIPVKVAINEAVEMCHRFADEKAAKFINGVLADLAEDAEAVRDSGEFKTTFGEKALGKK